MSPPQQVETTSLQSTKEKYDIKELSSKGYYFEFPKTKYPELEPFEHIDRGLKADPKKASLYDNATKIFDLTPQIGTEIHGLQLSQLTEQQKDDLALLVAERGVVFFRNQDIDPYQGKELGAHYGPLHVHLVSGHPPNLPEIVPVYFGKDISEKVFNRDFEARRTSEDWHSDISYELQPPALTFLKIDTLPGSAGGDTVWSSGYAAYDRLSSKLKETIEGLEAVHSGDLQSATARAKGLTVRRDNYEYVHPLVRTHPVTGWKSLFVNPVFTRRIVGMSKHESDALLKLLYDHIAGGYDFHVRFKWEEDSVAVWDNRITSHVAIFDYLDYGRRHGWRITSQGERPYYDPKSKSKREVEESRKATSSSE